MILTNNVASKGVLDPWLRKKKEQIVYLIQAVVAIIISYFSRSENANSSFFGFISLSMFCLCLIFFITYVAIRISCLFPLFCFSIDGIHSKGCSGRKIFIAWLEEIVISEEKSEDEAAIGYSVVAKSSSSPDLYSLFISKETAESYKVNRVIEKYSPPGHPLRLLGTSSA